MTVILVDVVGASLAAAPQICQIREGFLFPGWSAKLMQLHFNAGLIYLAMKSGCLYVEYAIFASKPVSG